MKTKKKLKNIWSKIREWSKIRDLIRSITKNSDDYDENYMKIKFIWMELPPNKMTEIPSMVIVVRAVIHENNKYYQQVFEMNVYINHE